MTTTPTQYGYVEIANGGATRFNNAADNDMVFYTDSSNQSIHFGVQQSVDAALSITRSNVQLNTDLYVPGQINLTGLKISKPSGVGSAGPNFVQNGVVTSVPGFDNSSSTHLKFGLSNAQTEFRFLNAGQSNIATIDGSGNMQLGSTSDPGNISAGNLGMFRNRIINGDMRINQRGATTVVSGVGSTANYFNDRWYVTVNITTGGLTSSNVSLTVADAPFAKGFRRSMRVTATTACTNYDWILPAQKIEGVHIDDFMWGTSVGTSVTLSFWFRANLANTKYAVAVRNTNISAFFRYNAEITTSSVAGEWAHYAITIPPPPTGSSWNVDNSAGIEMWIGLSPSPKNAPTTAFTWVTTNLSTNASNWAATVNNYIEFTGVQLEKGTLATPFEFRPQSIELQLCQRYYEKLFGELWGTYSTGHSRVQWYFKATKRVSNTGTFVTAAVGSSGVDISPYCDQNFVQFVVYGSEAKIKAGTYIDVELL